MDPYQPRKIVGKLKPQHPLRRLEQLNAFVRALAPKVVEAQTSSAFRDGTWTVRKAVGRPRSR